MGVHMRRARCHFHDLGDCDGMLTRHHVVEKRRIKDARSGAKATLPPGAEEPPLVSVALQTILEDERNLVIVCDRHHHKIHHAGLRLRSLPDDIDGFGVDYALSWAVERAREMHSDAMRHREADGG